MSVLLLRRAGKSGQLLPYVAWMTVVKLKKGQCDGNATLNLNYLLHSNQLGRALMKCNSLSFSSYFYLQNKPHIQVWQQYNQFSIHHWPCFNLLNKILAVVPHVPVESIKQNKTKNSPQPLLTFLKIGIKRTVRETYNPKNAFPQKRGKMKREGEREKKKKTTLVTLIRSMCVSDCIQQYARNSHVT